jgi:hypothetical protein
MGLSNSTDLKEPVPRFTKRSGDFVIQGSNNSLICLGTDRYWKKEEEPVITGSNAYAKNIEPFSGVVDIVAGRARSLSYTPESPKRTASPIFKHENNDSIDSEIEKGRLASKVEGDPDFYLDAARLYVSMKSELDDALSLKDYTSIIPGEDAQRLPSTGSAVIAKADHVRIVARKDEELGINGSIKIIKEGFINKQLAGDNPMQGCSISLLEEGYIHLAGQKIFLGLSTDDSGIEEFMVKNGSELKGLKQPYVKYQELKQLLINLIVQIGELRKDVDSHIKKFNSHTHMGTCPTGGPVTIQAPTSKASIKVKEFKVDESARSDGSSQTDYDEMLEKIKSLRIFGE